MRAPLMKRFLYAWLLCLCSSLSAKPVVIETAVWPGFTNADGSGAYFDLIRQVLPPADYPLDIRINHLGRAWLTVQRGQADLGLGLTQYDIQAFQLERSALPYDEDVIVALYLPSRVPAAALNPTGLATLQLGWEKSYNYGVALHIDAVGYEVSSPAHAVELLLAQRIDVYLAELEDLAGVQKKLKSAGIQQQWLANVPVYVGFSPTPQGRQLKQLWDQRVKLQWENGDMQRFYQRFPQLKAPQIGKDLSAHSKP